jgi:hypothetical protein
MLGDHYFRHLQDLRTELSAELSNAQTPFNPFDALGLVCDLLVAYNIMRYYFTEHRYPS